MKLAIVYATFYVRGGAENAIIWLTAELLERGHQVTIFTSEYDHHDPDIPEAVRQCFVEMYAGGNYSTFVDWVLAGWRLRKRLQQFDLVNPHNFPANVWVYFAKRFSRSFPHIIWYCQEPPRTLYEPEKHVQKGRYPSMRSHLMAKFRRDGLKTLFKIFQKTLFFFLKTLFPKILIGLHIRFDQQAVESCDLVLGNSKYTALKVQNIYHRQAIACPLGVHIQNIPLLPSESKKDFFLTVTRLEPIKHVDAIIKAVNILVTEHRISLPVSLVIIGSGNQEEALKALVSCFDLQKQVTFIGYVPYNSPILHQYYRDALGFIFVAEDEPFGLVPVEAMYHKTAVIAANQGGMLETVIDGETGMHVSPHDPEEIADAMRKLLNDREYAIRMGEKGHQHVMQHFTFSHFVNRFEGHMKKICESE